MEANDELRAKIVAQARTWEGVKYRNKGRDRVHGVDCIGLIIKVAHELGVSDFDTVEYPDRPIPRDLVTGMRGHLAPIPLDALGNGDVALFRGPQVPCHTGIVEVDEAGQKWVIHSFAPARKVLRSRLEGDLYDQLALAFRYTGN
jgi:hypothetical protein